jgi:hypothetical protein
VGPMFEKSLRGAMAPQNLAQRRTATGATKYLGATTKFGGHGSPGPSVEPPLIILTKLTNLKHVHLNIKLLMPMQNCLKLKNLFENL